MINLVEFDSNDILTGDLEKLCKVGDKIYAVTPAELASIKEYEDMLKVLVQKIILCNVLNVTTDTHLDGIIDLLYTADESEELFNNILVVAYNEDKSVDTKEKLIDEINKDKYYLDRLLNNSERRLTETDKSQVKTNRLQRLLDAEIAKSNTLQEELKAKTEHFVHTANECNNRMKDLSEQYEKILELKEDKLEEMKKELDKLKLELESANNEISKFKSVVNKVNARQFVTDINGCDKPVHLSDNEKSVIPVMMNEKYPEYTRVAFKDVGKMEFSIPTVYRAEIIECFKNNPAYVLEFVATKLPYLIPIIYRHYK